MDFHSYHIKSFGPTKPWPNGGWSLYRITGDQIAECIESDLQGKVTVRHSWPGYIGLFATLPELMAAIERDQS